MTDMPETIYASPIMGDTTVTAGTWIATVHTEVMQSPPTEYRRADLAPKVKPLVWDKSTARCATGTYVVAEADNECQAFWFVYKDSRPFGVLGEHPDEVSAKRAVEAYRERRILSQLEGWG